jgi:hypothetical protein
MRGGQWTLEKIDQLRLEREAGIDVALEHFLELVFSKKQASVLYAFCS